VSPFAPNPHNSYYHVVPVGDLREHILDQDTCWCHPTIVEDELLIVHHSMDQREAYERGERKPH
jgi:hypothetical protein